NVHHRRDRRGGTAWEVESVIHYASLRTLRTSIARCAVVSIQPARTALNLLMAHDKIPAFSRTVKYWVPKGRLQLPVPHGRSLCSGILIQRIVRAFRT